MRDIREIIIHYSATPEGEDFTVAQIRAWHKARGWRDIGYHWVIYRDGSIHAGRPENEIGAHTAGHNAHSIGICYIGGCPKRTVKNWQNIGLDTRTPQQKEALRNLIAELKRRYPKATLHGHCEFAAKPCPGFNVKTQL